MESSPAVVVGVDGSRPATAAALWAIPEAVNRSIPLRLVYAIDPRSVRRDDPDDANRRLAHAESVIRTVSTMVAARDATVKVEFEIVSGRPASALLRAAGSAPLICVGSVGFKRFAHGHLGSTAGALASSGIAMVAIVRAHDQSDHSVACGAVVLEMDASPRNGAVLNAAIDEARLRRAPIRAVTCWRSTREETASGESPGQNPQYQTRAYLYRHLAHYKRRYPDLTIHAVTAYGSMADYLAATDTRSIQLVVVRVGERGVTGQLGGPSVSAALRNTHGTVLICRP